MTSTSKKDWKIVNDAIFGFIELKPYIVKIIDTVEFQRLRWIWQLGVAPFVYPTADHCRFEHSIGTYHLASKLVTKLQKQLKKDEAEIKITDDDVKCVEIAALCHDIGHGPFSHVWDNTVLPNILAVEEITKHEDHFLPVWNSKFKDIVNDAGVDGKLIADLINGKATKGKEILSTIVSNSESGMDVDKWDYLARDASYLGHSSTNYRIDIERMIHFARAIKDTKDGKWKIAFRKSEGLNMLRVFQLRHYMHKTAYQHKTVKAIEEMMLDGLKQYFKKTENKPLLKQIGTPEWILRNDDSFVLNIMKSEDNSEFKRILERDLYRLRMEAVIYERVNDDPSDEIKISLKLKIFFREIKIESEIYQIMIEKLNQLDKYQIISENLKSILQILQESDESKINENFNELDKIDKCIIEKFNELDQIVKSIIRISEGYINEEIIKSFIEKLKGSDATVQSIIDKFDESDTIITTIFEQFDESDAIDKSIIDKFNESNEIKKSIIKKVKESDAIVKSIIVKLNKYKIKEETIKSINEKINILDEIVKKYFRFTFLKFKLDSTKGEKKSSNSLCNIPFYEKNAPDTIFRYKDDNIPSYLKYNVDESRIMIFTIQDMGIEVNEIQSDLEDIFKAKKWHIE